MGDGMGHLMVLRRLFASLLIKKKGMAKIGYLNGIFGHFGALRGST